MFGLMRSKKVADFFRVLEFLMEQPVRRIDESLEYSGSRWPITGNDPIKAIDRCKMSATEGNAYYMGKLDGLQAVKFTMEDILSGDPICTLPDYVFGDK